MNRSFVVTVVSVALAACGGGARTVSGTLVSSHTSALTAVATAPYAQRISAPVAADGHFSLSLPSAGDYRVRFVADDGRRTAVVASVVKPGTGTLMIFKPSGPSRVELGKVGSEARALAMTPAGTCHDDGEHLEAEHDCDGDGAHHAEQGLGDAEHEDGEHDDDDGAQCGAAASADDDDDEGGACPSACTGAPGGAGPSPGGAPLPGAPAAPPAGGSGPGPL